MLRVISPLDDEILTILFITFVGGCDELNLKGRNNIRLRAKIMDKFDVISDPEDNGQRRKLKEGQSALALTQEEYELFDKCWDVFSFSTHATSKVTKALDIFSAATKE